MSVFAIHGHMQRETGASPQIQMSSIFEAIPSFVLSLEILCSNFCHLTKHIKTKKVGNCPILTKNWVYLQRTAKSWTFSSVCKLMVFISLYFFHFYRKFSLPPPKFQKLKYCTRICFYIDSHIGSSKFVDWGILFPRIYNWELKMDSKQTESGRKFVVAFSNFTPLCRRILVTTSKNVNSIQILWKFTKILNWNLLVIHLITKLNEFCIIF